MKTKDFLTTSNVVRCLQSTLSNYSHGRGVGNYPFATAERGFI